MSKWRPIAWVSALALAVSGVVFAQQVVSGPSEAQGVELGLDLSGNPYKLTSVTGYNLTSDWMPENFDSQDVLFATGISGPKVADDSGVRSASDSFVGYFVSSDVNDERALITEEDAYLAAGYTRDLDNNYSRMSAADADRQVLYIWPNDAYDLWKSAANHPAEFTAVTRGNSVIGTDPNYGKCSPNNWSNSDRGSWVSFRAYDAGSVTPQVFWVPNPRSADFMTQYDQVLNANGQDYPGTYTNTIADSLTWSDNNPNTPDGLPVSQWHCRTGSGLGTYDDGWGGGEVIRDTGELFLVSRQSSRMSSTFRAAIYDPATGIFASSGMMRPEQAEDNIFQNKDAQLIGDLAINDAGEAYMLAKGQAPAGSALRGNAPANAWRTYLIRISPKKNPNWTEGSNESRYVHNGGWTYSVVSQILGSPDQTCSGGGLFGDGSGNNLCESFTLDNASGYRTSTVDSQTLKASGLFNNQLYVANDNFFFRINLANNLAYNVSTPNTGRGDDAARTDGFLSALSSGLDRIKVRDMASLQQLVTISGKVFYDKNADGQQDIEDGEWGIPSVNLVLYSDDDNNGVWEQATELGATKTNSSGDYTFFLPRSGNYQVRVHQAAFNPDADVNSTTFDQDVATNTKRTVQTAASVAKYQSDDPLAAGLNEVVAHCSANGSGAETTASAVTADTGDVEMVSCAGALPFTETLNEPGAPGIGDTSVQPVQMPIYSTVKVASVTTGVPDTNFGLATVNDYQYAVVSNGGTGSFAISDSMGEQTITTTVEGQAVTAPMKTGRPGQQPTTITLPAGWAIDEVETVDSTGAVQTVTLTNPANQFVWTLPAVGDIKTTITVSERSCNAATSDLELNPAGPIEAGQAYTATVTLRDSAGNICQVPTPVTFSGVATDPVDNGPLPVSGFTPQNTCTSDAITGQCEVQITSLKAGKFDIHAKINDTDLGGNGDQTKASPQNREWEAGPCSPDNTAFLVTGPGPETVGTGQYTLDVEARDAYGNLCD
ncbi:MAG: hypothetical protein LBL92_00650, partial [Propionibacteriaceae bacterium]|nr:hypothetical protein [Propionibacteriaceae bacterium]